jgi:Zn-dependent protease
MSLQIAKVKGIPIRAHFTLLVTFILISWTIAVRFTPPIYPDLSSAEYWTIGVSCAIVLFSSVVIHELSHSVLALRYGLHVREITLFIFGGVSNIEDLDVIGERKLTTPEEVSREFRKEFKIALAGPIASFSIAAIMTPLFLLLSQGSSQSEFALSRIAEIVLLYGAIVNTLLGLFNLVPAFPLDGGRMLRASILRWKKDYERATKISARIGVIISYCFMGSGFIIMFFGDFFGGMWILLIGWFLNNGARSYISQHQIFSLLDGLKLREIMNTNIVYLKDTFTVNESLTKYFNKYAKDSFPVLDDQGHLLGVVTFKEASNIHESAKGNSLIQDIMIPVNDLVIMPEYGAVDEALMKMARKPVRRIFVCDKDGKLLGLVSKTDIMNVAIRRKEFMKNVKKF